MVLMLCKKCFVQFSGSQQLRTLAAYSTTALDGNYAWVRQNKNPR